MALGQWPKVPLLFLPEPGQELEEEQEAGQPGQPDQAGLQVSEPAWLPAELSGRPSAAGIPPGTHWLNRQTDKF